MSDATETIRKWSTAAMVLAIIYTLLALILIPADGGALLVGSLAICALLLWAGFGLAKSGSYVPATVCLIIAGVIGLPLGAIAIIAGIQIKKAGDALAGGQTR